MKQYKVTNRTQGRLEIKEAKKVLDAGAWVILAEPLPESVRFMMGGGPKRKVDVVEVFNIGAKGAPASAPKPAEAPQADASPERPSRKGKTD